jgi:hypothetical protein
MPNHITTVCTVTGPPDDVNALRSLCIVKDEKGILRFDFDHVIPMPSICREVESGSEAECGFWAITGLLNVRFLALLPNPIAFLGPAVQRDRLGHHEMVHRWLEKNRPDIIEKGRKMLACLRETGSISWYEWACDHWGTKWNAHDFIDRQRVEGREVFEFQTANGVAEPIFEALTKRWPAIEIEVVAIDEGGPQYVGKYSNGSGSVDRVPDDDDRYFMVYGRRPNQEDDEESETTNG